MGNDAVQPPSGGAQDTMGGFYSGIDTFQEDYFARNGGDNIDNSGSKEKANKTASTGDEVEIEGFIEDGTKGPKVQSSALNIDTDAINNASRNIQPNQQNQKSKAEIMNERRINKREKFEQMRQKAQKTVQMGPSPALFNLTRTVNKKK